MHSPLLLLSALFLVFVFVQAVTNQEAQAAGVLVLDDDNFDEELENNSFLLVEFYAPWCGHCKSLAPEWLKTAKSLAASNSVAKLGQVDATVAKELATRFGVQGFPTIKLFKNGNPSDYDGGRTEAEILSWISKKSGPPAKELKSVDDLTSAQEASDAIVLGYFASLDSDAAKTFVKAADAGEEVYTITSSAEIKEKLGLKGDAVVILKSFDDLRNDLPFADAAALQTETIEEFVAANISPLVQTFSDAASKKIFGSSIKVHNLFFTEKTAAHHEPVMSAMTAAAKDFKGRTLFVNVPSTESRVLDYFGIKAADLPTLVTVDMSGGANMRKFFLTGDLTTASVTQHTNAFFADELKPSLKSEEPLPEDTAGDVKVVKGKSFHDLVINNSHDVLVEFYAPWCGHCKKLEPIYNELAAKVKSNDKIVIAKMDATANEIDIPGVEVKGFPTILFFKGDDKAHPVVYENAREFKDFLEFLETSAHNKFSSDEL